MALPRRQTPPMRASSRIFKEIIFSWAAPHNSARGSSERFCPKIKFGKRRNTLCTRRGVCRIRKPAYAGNGCAIFQVFQTAILGRKIRCCPQTQLCGVALFSSAISTPLPGLCSAKQGDVYHSKGFYKFWACSSQSRADASLGIFQSPLGLRPIGSALTPSGIQLRLNCWVINRR